MIVYPQRFHSAAPAGFDGVFDWDFLKPAFAPTAIEPMDIDCLVERYGQFLVIETKSGEKPIPRGQVISLEALAATGFFTVVILRSKTAADVNGWDVWRHGRSGILKKHVEGDAAALVDFCRRWFEWAGKSGRR